MSKFSHESENERYAAGDDARRRPGHASNPQRDICRRSLIGKALRPRHNYAWVCRFNPCRLHHPCKRARKREKLSIRCRT